ncbi:MAG: hypothetical protein HDQ94_00410 [Desulfovibrio sp.]|nr:hypothetical protein [Desulfovibrio sp.]
MDRQDSRKILERFFELLEKQTKGAENASPPLPFGPGEVITLRVESVHTPRKRSRVPVQLDVESEIRLVALLYHLHCKNKTLNSYIKGFWKQVDNSFLLASKDDTVYGTEFPEYLMRQKLLHLEPERIAAILGEVREPEFVSGLLDLLREVDPERADAVAAALPPSPEAMQAEIEALRRQVSELTAERDALRKAQLPSAPRWAGRTETKA